MKPRSLLLVLLAVAAALGALVSLRANNPLLALALGVLVGGLIAAVQATERSS